MQNIEEKTFDTTIIDKVIKEHEADLLEYMRKKFNKFYIANFGVDPRFTWLSYSMYTDPLTMKMAARNINVSVDDIHTIQFQEITAAKVKESLEKKQTEKAKVEEVTATKTK